MIDQVLVEGRKRKNTWEEMTELERVLEEHERLRTKNAFLKKLRELQLRDAAIECERQKLFEKWSQEDSDWIYFSEWRR